MTALISNNGEFGNGLKFEARASGHALSHGPVYGSAGYLALRLSTNNNDTTVYLHSSTDGVTWNNQSHNMTIPFAYITNIKYINGKYFIFGDNGSAGSTFYLSYSTDMVNWTNISNNTLTGSALTDITFSNNLYLLAFTSGLEGYVYSSSNLSTFTLRTTLQRDGSGSTVSQSIGLTRFATNGTNTVIMGVERDNSSSGGKLYPIYSYSSNGTTWSSKGVIGPRGGGSAIDKNPYDIASLGGTSFIMVGSGGMIYISANMSTWTATTSGTSADLYSVNYANSKYVVYGGPSLVLTSSNGSTWTSQTLPIVQNDDILYNSNGADRYSKPVYTNSKWTVGNYISSDNGSTWSILDYQIPNKQPFIKYPNDSAWDTWKTMDWWVYVPTYNHPNIYTTYAIASKRGSTSNTTWSVYLEQNQIGSGSLTLRFAWNSSVKYSFYIYNTFNYNAWNHMRIVSDGTNGAFYLNGTRISGSDFSNGGASTSIMTTPSSWGDGTDTLNVGYTVIGAENQYSRLVDYYIDELMITQEVINSPNATSITVPTRPWQNNEYTSILLHFDTNFEDDPNTPIRNATAFVDATFTEVTNASKIVKTPVALSTTASQTTNGTKAVNTSASLSATASLTATLSRTKQFSASLVVAASELTANARTRGFGAILTSTAVVSATPTKQFGAFTASLSATASLSGNLVKIKEFSANLVTTGSTLIADTRTRGDGANLTATVTLTTSAVRTRRTAVALTTTATVTAQTNRIKQFSSNLVVGASELTVDQKTARTSVTLSTTAALSSTAKRTRSGTATISCQANIVVEASQSRIIGANLSTTSSLFVSSGNVVRTSANLQVGAFAISTGRVLNIVDSPTWIVPAENTTWVIARESTEWIIPYEERTFTF